ncbi:type ISP restriction/modification enzyme [Sutterella wadsworthensis]
MRVDGKKASENSIFKNYSRGVATSRDAWVYGSNKRKVLEHVANSITFYNSQVKALAANPNYEIDLDPKKMKWDRLQKNTILRGKIVEDVSVSKLYLSYYRPFFTQYLYLDRFWNNCVYQMPAIFPTCESKNLLICSSGVGSKEFSCLMTNCIVDLQLNFNGQCFPRWLPGEQAKEAEDTFDFGEPSEMPSGFSPEALPHFQAAYLGKPITEDDLFYYIYGILHSEDYRTRYANNLMKELPRIPRVATYEQFMAFVEAGQELARLHVHFEDVAPYAGIKFEYTKVGQPSYRVTQMKWGKIKGKTGNAAKDKTTLIYNDWITVKNIPLEAQEYVVNKKSALDWVVERACVSIDKASGIVNDFNDYAAEMGSERYPLDLFLKVITVSLETMKIVKTLPKLEIHPLDSETSG